MQSNLAMDLRRLAMENEQAAASRSGMRAAEAAPRMTELQRIFKRLESAGASR